MQSGKKWLALFMALMLLLGLLPVFSFAEDPTSGDYGELHWDFNKVSGEMVLTGVGDYAYRREDGVYIVPIGCLG